MDSEIARGKWVLVAGFLFLVSLFITYNEVMYLLTGTDTRATVTAAAEVIKRGRFGINRGIRLQVDYQFSDNENNRRTGQDTVDMDWLEKVRGGTVAVRFRPGKDGSSRLAGHVNCFGPIVLGISMLILGFTGYRLWKEANDTSPRKPKRAGA
jgi:hypothetical protein